MLDSARALPPVRWPCFFHREGCNERKHLGIERPAGGLGQWARPRSGHPAGQRRWKLPTASVLPRIRREFSVGGGGRLQRGWILGLSGGRPFFKFSLQGKCLSAAGQRGWDLREYRTIQYRPFLFLRRSRRLRWRRGPRHSHGEL